MTVNMGKFDRGARIVIALGLLVAAFGSEVAASGVLHWLAIAVAVVFLVTSLIGNCPLYSIFGFKTCRSK